MEYQKAANREINNLHSYIKDGTSSFATEVAIYLGSAVVYALLDIAQAIREFR